MARICLLSVVKHGLGLSLALGCSGTRSQYTTSPFFPYLCTKANGNTWITMRLRGRGVRSWQEKSRLGRALAKCSSLLPLGQALVDGPGREMRELSIFSFTALLGWVLDLAFSSFSLRLSSFFFSIFRLTSYFSSTFTSSSFLVQFISI